MDERRSVVAVLTINHVRGAEFAIYSRFLRVRVCSTLKMWNYLNPMMEAKSTVVVVPFSHRYSEVK